VKRTTVSIFVIIFTFCLVCSNIAATGIITSAYAKKHTTTDSDKSSSSDSSSGDEKSSNNGDKSTGGGDSSGNGEGTDTGTGDTNTGSDKIKDTNTQQCDSVSYQGY
jgi:hypothetical protein